MKRRTEKKKLARTFREGALRGKRTLDSHLFAAWVARWEGRDNSPMLPAIKNRRTVSGAALRYVMRRRGRDW